MRSRVSAHLSRGGFTLPEILVAASLLAILVALMVALLVPSFSLYRRQSGKSDTYRTCHLLVEKFTQGLLNSQLETVTILDDSQAISWQQGQPDPPFSATSGQTLMSNRFHALHWDMVAGRVIMEDFELSSAESSSVLPTRLEPAQLAGLRTSISPTERVVALNVTQFAINDNDDNLELLHPPLRLSITCTVSTRGTATNDEENFSMEASVTPRSRRW